MERLRVIMEEFSKTEKLNKAIERLNLEVTGLENFPKNCDDPVIAIANHGHIMDIFYLAASIPEEHVTIVSNRLTYKRIPERQKMVYDYLHPLPIEGTLGSYANISLNAATNLLVNGINIGIFPEGVLNDGTVIVKGRTGIIRALFNARKMGVKPILLPVAIDVKSSDPNLDRCGFNFDDNISVKILERMEYEAAYQEYLKFDSNQEENQLFHGVLDRGMKAIADELKVPFTGEYGFFYPKSSVMFQDGSTVALEDAENPEYYERFRQEIASQENELIRALKRKERKGK